MPRLRRVSTQDPGWRRVHHGRGFRYLDVDGTPLRKEEVERVKALVIPPAWRNVWISPYPNAHLQAVGTDGAGRRQYLYHPAWRVKRDEAKFDRVIEMAAELPAVRRRLRADLARADARPETVLSAAVRLVDLGCFRLGSDTYTVENGSYGLTTLERRHLRKKGAVREFSFVGESGVEEQAGRAKPATSRTAKAKRVRQAVVGASELLGNTPTVCRASYVDPRVIDLYEGGTTIAPALSELSEDPEEARDHVDAAVIALLSS